MAKDGMIELERDAIALLKPERLKTIANPNAGSST
jgi:hypothetical protein